MNHYDLLRQLERGRRVNENMRKAMCLAHALNPYGTQPHEIKVLPLWNCVCAVNDVMPSGVAWSYESAKSAINACGSNQAASERLQQIVALFELARPHLGSELQASGDGTCIKWLRVWMQANGLLDAETRATPDQVSLTINETIEMRNNRWLSIWDDEQSGGRGAQTRAINRIVEKEGVNAYTVKAGLQRADKARRVVGSNHTRIERPALETVWGNSPPQFPKR